METLNFISYGYFNKLWGKAYATRPQVDMGNSLITLQNSAIAYPAENKSPGQMSLLFSSIHGTDNRKIAAKLRDLLLPILPFGLVS